MARHRDESVGRRLASTLSEEQLASLYELIARRSPPREDRERPRGGYTLTERDEIGEWRDSLIRALAARQTLTAIAHLRRVLRSAIDHDRWYWIINKAETEALAHTWPRPSPSDLLTTARDPRQAIVESEAHLLGIVGDSLGRYAARLRGENPIAFTLWDGNRPKDEESFSDALTDHLKVDIGGRRIVVNREVQIRRSRGEGQPGERTDIHVDAHVQGAAKDEFKLISVIVEVKGCWNKGAMSALGGQLHDRYLRDNHCRHGLYVVGWFHCPQWAGSDYRKSRTAQVFGTVNGEEASRLLELQARATSDPQKGVEVRAIVIDARQR